VTTSTSIIRNPSVAAVSAARKFGLLSSFALAGSAGFALTATIFVESFHSARLAVVLAALVLFHLMRFQRVFVSREIILYAFFCLYMLIQLLWVPDLRLAMNTVVPAVSCLLTMIFFGSLIAYHDVRTVLAGILSGFLLGAAVYSFTTGFPFTYPSVFSYNAIASMYLFGLIITLLLGCFARSSAIFLVIAIVVLMHIVATTSIKNNLGILLGGVGASLVYFGDFAKSLRRNALSLFAFGTLLGYVLVTNSALMEILRRGVDRVIVGLKLLQAREDIPGYGGFGPRAEWQADGLSGWLQNPVFGYGPEAFRSQYGITSHSTYVDILYNSGLIGFFLYYVIFVSVALRLYSARHESRGNLFPLVAAGLICYLSISFSGIQHYSPTFVAFIAISAGLLLRQHYVGAEE
jgi:O-antigen ligase